MPLDYSEWPERSRRDRVDRHGGGPAGPPERAASTRTATRRSAAEMAAIATGAYHGTEPVIAPNRFA